MHIKVQCYSGYRGDETPRCFWIKDREVAVREVIDRWLAPDHRYFKISGDDGAVYILRHGVEDLQWELTFYRAPEKEFKNSHEDDKEEGTDQH